MEEIEEIDLREIFSIIWSRKWIIIAISLLAMIISGLISFYVLQAEYETSTTIMVGKSNTSEQGIEYNDVLLNQKLVNTYGVIIQSKGVLSEVISNLKLDLTVDELKGQIKVSPVSDTEIIEIKVSGTDPILISRIANDVSSVFMRNVTDIMKIDNVQIIDRAETPENPIKPNKTLNILIAGVLGLMIGLGIVFLREFLDNTFKTPNDVEKHLGLSIIGVIPFTDDLQ